jgi:uncharacterized protein (DUF885 family)
MKIKTSAEDDKLKELATSFETEYFERHPERGLQWGYSNSALDRFMDHSYAAHQDWERKESAYLESLNQINPKNLSKNSEITTYQLLKQSLEASIATRICKNYLWDVNSMRGWVQITTMLADKQPVETAELRALALLRWDSFGTIADAQIENLKIGLKQGYSAPKPVVERVINQLKIIAKLPIEQSPYFELSKRTDDLEFKLKISHLIEVVINPALKRYSDYLEHDYLSAARTKIGISALPNGESCYHANVLKETTIHINAQQIHEHGLKQIESIRLEVSSIGMKLFGISEMAQVFLHIKSDPQYYFKSEQDILKYNFSALDRANLKIPEWFKLIPKTKCTLKPSPLYRAKTGAPGEYHPPSDDSSRPGIFYINTYQAHQRSRAGHESILFHELLPGHHFQFSLAMEDKSHHSLDKYLWNAGYGEGWALYTERLADEMGLYSDDISRLGMLSNEALRAARLVIDPGIHTMGWSREKAIDYLRQNSALDLAVIENEVDRYIIMPGQATSYMLGKREIDNLRQLAQAKLGSSFSIKEFHHQVLKNGAVTLPMLRDQIESFLMEQTNELP